MGKGRTTTGMIVACLVRDVLGGAVPSHKPMVADKNELPDEEEFLEEQHRWGQQTGRGGHQQQCNVYCLLQIWKFRGY